MRAMARATLVTIFLVISTIGYAQVGLVDPLTFTMTMEGAGGGTPVPVSWQNGPYAQYVGDWVGLGWGWETRFKSSDMGANPGNGHDMMTLTVRHLARFDFTVDKNGQIKGDGEITYDLDPNLCGVYRAAQEVNMAIDVLKSINEAPDKMRKLAEQANNLFSMKTIREATDLQGQVEAMADSIKDEGKTRATSSMKSYVKQGLGMEANDTADLAKNVIYQRCMQNVPVVVFNSMVCESEKSGKGPSNAGEFVFKALADSAAGVGHGESDYWNQAVNALYNPGPTLDQAKASLEKKTIKALNVFDVQEKPGKDACAGVPSTQKAGTSINNVTKEEMMQSWAETFQSMAKAGATGNVAGVMGAGTDLIMNAPGVTKVQYDYKGLKNGPESRRFKIKGHIEGDKAYLQIDGDVYGGDKDLYVEYVVNWQKGGGKFPAWSPFIESEGAELSASGKMKGLARKTVPCSAADLKKNANCKPTEQLVTTEEYSSTPFAFYHKTGEHRNNVKPWHEYEYYWRAQRVTAPVQTAVGPGAAK